MITPISKSQITKTNYTAVSKQAATIAFSGNFAKLGKNLVEESNLKFSAKFGRFIEEATESISKGFRKLIGDNELPFTKEPLTANGKITHIGPNGESISIDVEDAAIKNAPFCDGQNFYKLTGDGSIKNDISSNNLIKEAETLIQKEAQSIKPEFEREIDPTKIVFGPDDMPVRDVDGKPICEFSGNSMKTDFDLEKHIDDTHQKTDISIDDNTVEHQVNDYDLNIDDIDS